MSADKFEPSVKGIPGTIPENETLAALRLVLASPSKVQGTGLTAELAKSVQYLIETGDQASRKKPHVLYILSSEQKNRAQGLGFAPERMRALTHVNALCLSTLRKIIDEEGLLPNAGKHLNNIIESFVSGDFLRVEDTDIPKVELEMLIAIIFSEENIKYGIPYIMSYFLEFIDPALKEQVLNVRVLTGMLDFWRQIGSKHELFGRVAMKYVGELDVFKCYTPYFDKKWYFSVPLVDPKGKVCLQDYEVAGVDDIPDTFARIGMHKGTEDDIALDIAHYETIYVLGGDVYRYLRPAVKGLRGFIKKHQEFLSQPGNTPWENIRNGEEKAWQGARIFLNQLEESRTSQSSSETQKKKAKKNRKPSPSPAYTPPTATQTSDEAKPIQDTEKTIQATYPLPTIKKDVLSNALCIKTHEGTTGSVSLSVSSFCENIPEGAYLCIKEGTNNWHDQRHTANDSIDFNSIKPGKTSEFVFCFVGEGQKPSVKMPHTTISITAPKIRKNDSIEALRKTVPTSVNTALTRFSTPAPTPPSGELQIPGVQKLEDTPTDILALEILGNIENLDIIRENPEVLLVRIHGRTDITIAYNLKGQSFTGRVIPEGVDFTELLGVVQGDIGLMVSTYLTREIESLCTRALDIEERRTRVLLSRLPDFGSRDEILELCRQDDCNTGIAILREKNLTHLQSLQSAFSQLDITLSIIKEGKEMRLSIGLSSLGKNVNIVSKGSAPYFAIENEENISEHERRLAKNIFLLISVLGRLLIGLPRAEKAKTEVTGSRTSRSSNPDMQVLSHEEILEIIAGTYKPKTISIESLSPDKIDRLRSAIKRFDEERGRLFVSGGFSDTLGFYRCHVEGHKGWELSTDAWVVLTDEKISSVPKGRTGQPYVYDMLQGNDRLQKYFILKMIATAKSISAKKTMSFRGKRPFSNGLGEYFVDFWRTIPDSSKNEFMNQVASDEGKARNGLSFSYMLDGETIFLFQSFIDGIREKKIPLIYSRPQIMSFDELQEYKSSLQEIPIGNHED